MYVVRRHRKPLKHHQPIIKHHSPAQFPSPQNLPRARAKGEKEKKERKRRRRKEPNQGDSRGRREEFDATKQGLISQQTKKNG